MSELLKEMNKTYYSEDEKMEIKKQFNQLNENEKSIYRFYTSTYKRVMIENYKLDEILELNQINGDLKRKNEFLIMENNQLKKQLEHDIKKLENDKFYLNEKINNLMKLIYNPLD